MASFQHQVEALKQAINSFVGFKQYGPQGMSKLKAIQNTIFSYIKTVHCIPICLAILETEKVPEVQYFASQFIKDKLKYDFDQINIENISELHIRIVNLIKQYQEPSILVLSNLCLCLVYIYLHAVQQLSDPLSYASSSLKEVKNINYFIKFIQLLPEEMDSHKVVIDQQTRQKAIKKIIESQTHVLVQLNTIGLQQWKNLKIKKNYLLKAFANWIEIGYNNELMNQLANHSLVERAFESIEDLQLSDYACQCLLELLKKSHGPSQNPQLFKYLEGVIDKIVQKVANVIQDMDFQIAENYIALLCEFGMKTSKNLVRSFNGKVKHFLQKMLDFMKQDEIECYQCIMQFWQKFLQDMQGEKLDQQLHGIIKTLYMTMCYRMMYNTKFLKDLDTKTVSQMEKHYQDFDYVLDRRYWSEPVFKEMVKVLGKAQLLHIVKGCLQTLNQNKQDSFWVYIEVYIFTLGITMKEFPSFTNEMKAIIQTYQVLPIKHVAVKLAYLKFFKALMTVEEKDAEIITKVFTFIAQMFSQQLLIQKAQQTFLKACRYNPKIVCTNIADFLTLLNNFGHRQTILESVVRILNDDDELMKKYLPQIMFHYLQKYKNTTNIQEQRALLKSFMTIIKTITSNRTSPYEESVKSLFIELWPSFKQNMLNPKFLQHDQDPLIQTNVKLIKLIMRSIKKCFTGFLSQIFKTALQAYSKNPVSSLLYLFEVSITAYYDYYEYLDYFRQLYCDFCDLTFQHLKNIELILEYQFLVDDFIGMNKRFFVYNVQIPLKTNKIEPVISLCQLVSGVNIPKISKTAYQFIQILYVLYWNEEMVAEFNANQDNQPVIIKKQAKQLYQSIKNLVLLRSQNFLQIMIAHLSRSPIDSIAFCIVQAIQAQIKAFPDKNTEIWTKIMPSIPQNVLTRKQKQKFMGLLPEFQTRNTKSAERQIRKLLKNMNKRFAANKKRQELN